MATNRNDILKYSDRCGANWNFFILLMDYNILLICSIEQQYPSNNKWETFSE